MIDVLQQILVVILGLAGGLAVGSGFVAFITVLDIVPRLAQMTKAYNHIIWLERALIAGVVFFTWIDFRGITFLMPSTLTIIAGFLSGAFVGMLAAALTEVLNVLPILAKRLNMVHAILILLMAMVLGKVSGSLFHWIFFVP